MVEECCKFVNQTPDVETKLKFIDTLRTVTEGKVGWSLQHFICRGGGGKNYSSTLVLL